MEVQFLLAGLILIIQLLIYAGIAYLAFLGLRTLIQSRKTPKQEPPESKSSTGPEASRAGALAGAGSPDPHRTPTGRSASRRKKTTENAPGTQKAKSAGVRKKNPSRKKSLDT